MDDLINEFIAEAREMLQALSGAIVAWEAEPNDRARLDEIFRFVHTVKGNCGFFDLPRLQQLSHAAEDALAEVRAGTRTPDAALVSAVLAVIDRIGALVHALESGEALESEDDSQLIAALAAAPAAAGASPALESAPSLEVRKSIRSIRLPVELLDRIMSGVSDAVLARNELGRRLREVSPDIAVQGAFERLSGCVGEIRDAITRTRMQRVDSLFAALPRLVRDLSAELGKQVRLEVDGGDVELDREMIELIRDPLTHIIRNAIDHGIEPADIRIAAGKDPAGRIEVAARQAGNQILIEVCDDGRGIDTDALVRRAIASGLLTPDRAEALTPSQRFNLVFAPGLSTASEITSVSGRGVGMDVVRANIERVGGLIDVESRPGEGVRLTMRVPLTLTIIPALTIAVGGQVFAIPRQAIDEILRADAVPVDTLGEAAVINVRGRRLPLVDLAELLGLETRAGAARIILLKPAGGDVYALKVDAVHDHEELVVKPAAPAVMAAGLYAGTTLADDGLPILLLDPSGISGRAALSFEVAAGKAALVEPIASRERPMLLLFRSLAGALRAVPVASVERIEQVPAAAAQFSAGRLRVTLGETILPLAGCDQPPAEGRLRLLRLTDGESQLGYALAEVVDIRAVDATPAPPANPGEIAGLLLVDGEPVELIDPHWLFATHADSARPGDALLCALPLDDPWVANMLRPLVESLGYRVVATRDGAGDADLVVAGDGAPAGNNLIRLRATPEPAGPEDDSIYRYDRAALVAALSRKRGGARG